QDLMQFTAEDDEELPDGLNAKVAIEKLRELKDRDEPFFMGLGFYKPHLPFVAPKQDWDAVKDIPAPDAPHPDKPDSNYGSTSGEFFRYNMPFEKTRPLNSESRMQARRAYWACVRYVDRQVGRVLTALNELGLRDNTIVVVWGDHGWHLGDGEMWAKHVAHERALKSTLIVHVPGLHQSGSISNAIVQTTDLYPTLVDLCNLKDTKTEFPLDGRSLRSVLDGSRSKLHDSVVGYWRNSESIRNEHYRLIASRTRNGFENIELYDLRTTRDPLNNIADKHPQVVKQLLSEFPETSIHGRSATR
ncbi:MAG: sulfatase-like hydrolase/transferase, partial [Candidatus Hydrogenedentota bacterium]